MEIENGAVREGVFVPVLPGSKNFDNSIRPPLQNSYMYKESKQSFRYNSAFLINNATLQERYEAFRTTRRAMGYSEEELEESYGFLLFDDENKANKVGETGVVPGHSTCTTLGDPSKGVYVSKYSDCLDLNRWYHGKSGYIAIIRLTKGRVREVTENYTVNYTSPSNGFDCHVSEQLGTVSANTSSFLAFERTQYYMYELPVGVAVQPPSHVCPFAIVAFSYWDTKTPASVEQEKSEEERTVFHYYPWRGKLQISSQIYQVGLKSNTGPLIPAKLPTMMTVDGAIQMPDLRQKLPKDIFETCFSGEVSLEGMGCSLYELAPSEAEDTSLSQLTQELKEKDLALTIQLNDCGFLILLHSSHFLTYEDAGSNKPEKLQGLFVFPESRAIHRDTKICWKKPFLSPECLQVVPALNYAVTEVEKCLPSQSGELRGLLEQHIQSYTSLIHPGLTISPSREASIFPDQFDVPDALKYFFSAPKWTEMRCKHLKSYFHQPGSFEFSVSRATELLMAGREERGDEPDDDVYYCLSSPEGPPMSPASLGGPEEQQSGGESPGDTAADFSKATAVSTEDFEKPDKTMEDSNAPDKGVEEGKNLLLKEVQERLPSDLTKPVIPAEDLWKLGLNKADSNAPGTTLLPKEVQEELPSDLSQPAVSADYSGKPGKTKADCNAPGVGTEDEGTSVNPEEVQFEIQEKVYSDLSQPPVSAEVLRKPGPALATKPNSKAPETGVGDNVRTLAQKEVQEEVPLSQLAVSAKAFGIACTRVMTKATEVTGVSTSPASGDLPTVLVITATERTATVLPHNENFDLINTESTTNISSSLPSAIVQPKGGSVLNGERGTANQPSKPPEVSNSSISDRRKRPRKHHRFSGLGKRVLRSTVADFEEKEDKERRDVTQVHPMKMPRELMNLIQDPTLKKKERMDLTHVHPMKIQRELIHSIQDPPLKMKSKDLIHYHPLRNKESMDLIHDDHPLKKKTERWDLKAIISECGRIFVPHGSEVIAKDMESLKIKGKVLDHKQCADEMMVEACIKVPQPIETGDGPSLELNKSDENKDLPIGMLDSKDSLPEVKMADVGKMASLNPSELVLNKDIDSPSSGKHKKKRQYVAISLSQLKTVLSRGGKRNTSINPASEDQTSPLNKKSKADSPGMDEMENVNLSNINKASPDRTTGAVEVAKEQTFGLDPKFALALGLTPTELHNNAHKSPEKSDIPLKKDIQSRLDQAPPQATSGQTSEASTTITLMGRGRPFKNKHKHADSVRKRWLLHSPASLESEKVAISSQLLTLDLDVRQVVSRGRPCKGASAASCPPADSLTLLADLARSTSNDKVLEQQSYPKALEKQDGRPSLVISDNSVKDGVSPHEPDGSILQVPILEGLQQHHKDIFADRTQAQQAFLCQQQDQNRKEPGLALESLNKGIGCRQTFIEKDGSVHVTRLWKENYDFNLDSKFTNNPKDKTVIRGLHGPWDFDIKDTKEQVLLIIHMWIGLFYSRSTARFCQEDSSLTCLEENDSTEVAHRRVPGQIPPETKTSSPAYIALSRIPEPEVLDLSNMGEKEAQPLSLEPEVLDLSMKTTSTVLDSLDTKSKQRLDFKNPVYLLATGLHKETISFPKQSTGVELQVYRDCVDSVMSEKSSELDDEDYETNNDENDSKGTLQNCVSPYRRTLESDGSYILLCEQASRVYINQEQVLETQRIAQVLEVKDKKVLQKEEEGGHDGKQNTASLKTMGSKDVNKVQQLKDNDSVKTMPYTEVQMNADAANMADTVERNANEPRDGAHVDICDGSESKEEMHKVDHKVKDSVEAAKPEAVYAEKETTNKDITKAQTAVHVVKYFIDNDEALKAVHSENVPRDDGNTKDQVLTAMQDMNDTTDEALPAVNCGDDPRDKAPPEISHTEKYSQKATPSVVHGGNDQRATTLPVKCHGKLDIDDEPTVVHDINGSTDEALPMEQGGDVSVGTTRVLPGMHGEIKCKDEVLPTQVFPVCDENMPFVGVFDTLIQPNNVLGEAKHQIDEADVNVETKDQEKELMQGQSKSDDVTTQSSTTFPPGSQHSQDETSEILTGQVEIPLIPREGIAHTEVLHSGEASEIECGQVEIPFIGVEIPLIGVEKDSKDITHTEVHDTHPSQKETLITVCDRANVLSGEMLTNFFSKRTESVSRCPTPTVDEVLYGYIPIPDICSGSLAICDADAVSKALSTGEGHSRCPTPTEDETPFVPGFSYDHHTPKTVLLPNSKDTKSPKLNSGLALIENEKAHHEPSLRLYKVRAATRLHKVCKSSNNNKPNNLEAIDNQFSQVLADPHKKPIATSTPLNTQPQPHSQQPAMAVNLSKSEDSRGQYIWEEGQTDIDPMSSDVLKMKQTDTAVRLNTNAHLYKTQYATDMRQIAILQDYEDVMGDDEDFMDDDEDVMGDDVMGENEEPSVDQDTIESSLETNWISDDQHLRSKSRLNKTKLDFINSLRKSQEWEKGEFDEVLDFSKQGTSSSVTFQSEESDKILFRMEENKQAWLKYCRAKRSGSQMDMTEEEDFSVAKPCLVMVLDHKGNRITYENYSVLKPTASMHTQTVPDSNREGLSSFLEFSKTWDDTHNADESDLTQSSMDLETLIFSEKMNRVLKHKRKRSSSSRYNRSRYRRSKVEERASTCNPAVTVHFSSLQEDRDSSEEHWEAIPSLAGKRIRVEMPERMAMPEETDGEAQHLKKLSYTKGSEMTHVKVSDLVADSFKAYRAMMTEVCAGRKYPSRTERLKREEAKRNSSPKSRPPSKDKDFCGQMKEDMYDSLHDNLNSVVRQSCKNKFRFYILVTSSDPFFRETKELLEAEGHIAVKQSQFCLGKDSPSCPLHIILRNEDIAEHICEVPHLLELKKSQNVLFAGIDRPDDIVNLTHQELFSKGGFVVFEGEALHTLSLSNMKKMSGFLEGLSKKGKWKWLLHYRDSRKLKENSRSSAEAQGKITFMDICQEAGMVEVLPYHECDVISRERPNYLHCLVRLQVQNVSARLPVFITDTTADKAFAKHGIFTMNINSFLMISQSDTCTIS